VGIGVLTFFGIDSVYFFERAPGIFEAVFYISSFGFLLESAVIVASNRSLRAWLATKLLQNVKFQENSRSQAALVKASQAEL